MTGPLDGVRVADFTHFMAGPVSTLLLNDLGAEIIKVEPLHGEAGRLGGARPVPNGEGLTFQVHNRGKKSMTVDLNKAEGREVVADLIRVSDVVVENFRVGAIAKLGFGYEQVSKINPTIVMASISGFGHDSPYAHWPSVDFVPQAMSGLMDLNGQPGDPPTKYGVEMADYAGGIFGALSICGALYKRSVTGQGEYIDLGMHDTMTFQLNYHAIRYQYAGLEYGRIGNRTAGSGISGSYPCKDGHVAIASGGDIRWKAFAEMIGRPEMGDDPRFQKTADRWDHHDEIDEAIRAWTKQHTVAEAMEALHGHDQIAGSRLLAAAGLRRREREVPQDARGVGTPDSREGRDAGQRLQDAELEAAAGGHAGADARRAQRLRDARAPRLFHEAALGARGERGGAPEAGGGARRRLARPVRRRVAGPASIGEEGDQDREQRPQRRVKEEGAHRGEPADHHRQQDVRPGVPHHSRTKSPLLPPLFRTSRTDSMRIPGRRPFAMS